jgi:hypothetical protein
VKGGSVLRNGGLGAVVHDGAVRISVDNTHCENGLLPEDPTFSVAIGAGPLIDNGFVAEVHRPEGYLGECFTPSGCDVAQPAPVLAALGAHFERLRGAQVSILQGNRVLIARSKPYAWPKDACAPIVPQTRMAECPHQRSIFALTTRQLESYAGAIEGMANQWKPCMVWASASAQFRATHPWPSFRDQFTAWTEAVSRIPRAGIFPTHVITASGARIPFRDTTLPERLDVRYVLGDVPLATATLVLTTTAYELTDLDLILVDA